MYELGRLVHNDSICYNHIIHNACLLVCDIVGNEAHNGTNEMIRHIGYAYKNTIIAQTVKVITDRNCRIGKFSADCASELVLKSSANLMQSSFKIQEK